ncbi:unnamed protein product [Nezara viridula]|uniref:Neuropeptide n=1 Tax=Nezara viridula TaxID=85310 RepID=A0A9P0E7F3_NEZVI|nr:unnamed protein product [Nezara viridula]
MAFKVVALLAFVAAANAQLLRPAYRPYAVANTYAAAPALSLLALSHSPPAQSSVPPPPQPTSPAPSPPPTPPTLTNLFYAQYGLIFIFS